MSSIFSTLKSSVVKQSPSHSKLVLNGNSLKMLRKRKTVFVVALSSMDEEMLAQKLAALLSYP
jgi:hypothetical protein